MRLHQSLAVWLAILALTVLAFLPGLGGPFLFDDIPNIVKPLTSWLSGRSDWVDFVLGNHSGPLGRVLSMLSFAANGATTGLTTWPFKLTNLALHLGCGTLIYLLLTRLLRRDPQLNARGKLAAGLIAAVWLLHPIQVSTVLYVVQRMAQLSALFTFLALLAFVVGRQSLQAGRLRASAWQLWLWLPLCTVLAMASKETGALVPLLCAVIELAWFRRGVDQTPNTPRARMMLRVFLAVFIVLPLAVGAVFLLAKPGFYLNGYDGRLFTLGQRLLSEPRALMSYVGILLVPRGASLGLYTDDFPVSHGLLDPPTTLWAILGLAVWMVASLLLRKRVPAFFAGTWLFFCGHALESSIFPLELYFEHRNYLPSLGVFLAVAGLLGWALPHLRNRLPERSKTRLFSAAAVLGVVLLAGATAVRSSVWSTWVGIAEQGVREHPLSRRAHLDKIEILLRINRPQEARTLLQQMLHFPDPAAYSAAAFNLVWLDCKEKGATDDTNVRNIRRLVGRKLQLADLFGGEKLGNLLLQQSCAGLSAVEFASILRDMTANAGQRASNTPIWRLRFMASRLYAEKHYLQLAIEQSALAWMSGGADPAVGVYLINLYYAVGDRKSVDILLPQVRKKIPAWDQRNQHQLAKILSYFADGTDGSQHGKSVPLPVPDAAVEDLEQAPATSAQ